MIVSDSVADGAVFSCPSWVAFGVSLPALLCGSQSIDCPIGLLGSIKPRAAFLLFLFVVATDRFLGCVLSAAFLVGDLCLLFANWPDGS